MASHPSAYIGLSGTGIQPRDFQNTLGSSPASVLLRALSHPYEGSNHTGEGGFRTVSAPEDCSSLISNPAAESQGLQLCSPLLAG